ncbi:MAG: hypothetical protein VB142_03470 [Burkholderia sp.]
MLAARRWPKISRGGLHAVVLGDYESGRNLERGQAGGAPPRFLLFSTLTRLSRDEPYIWFAASDGESAEPSPAGIARLRKSVTRAEVRCGDRRDLRRAVRRQFLPGQLHLLAQLRRQGLAVGAVRRLRAPGRVCYGVRLRTRPNSSPATRRIAPRT